MDRLLRKLPVALTTLRLLLAPVLVWIVRDGQTGLPYVAADSSRSFLMCSME